MKLRHPVLLRVAGFFAALLLRLWLGTLRFRACALGKPGAFDHAPQGLRATQLPGARMGGSFLKVFGKPDRLLTCECERSESTTLGSGSSSSRTSSELA